MKCILPWINYGTTIGSRSRCCGYSDPEAQWKEIFEMKGWKWGDGNNYPECRQYLDGLRDSSVKDQWNNLYFRTIREKFLKDEWPANCTRCKKVEELGGQSKRIDENDMWWDDSLIKDTEYPKHIDVRTGSTCNFKCIHCSPSVSSRWVEDLEVAQKFGFDDPIPDNNWISKESNFWDSLDISKIKRYNFLGGESFYNKRHNDFIKKLNESEYAKEVEIAYVSNGSLKFENMENFKKVRLRLSVDCVEEAGEYFRYGLNWNDWCDNISNFPDNFDVSFQWTCSNVSMFYFVDTYELCKIEFPNIRFLTENHVSNFPWLSVQNLPKQIKDEIRDQIYFDMDPFYVNYMYEKDLWPEYGKTFINFLESLDKARNTNWKKSLCGLAKKLNGLI